MPQILVGDRYQVTERIGKGGMGKVYLAWDTRLRLWCALKVMARGTDAVARSRFAQEARVMARLSHPHLVRLYDLVDEVEAPYMAIEFMEGGTLARRLAHGPLSPRAAVSAAADVCGALQAAHDAGVVHRDVKPQNLLLDRAGVVKVADFGVARAYTDARLTLSNVALGTLAYMPPEQQRDASSVDARADVYSVGATLYALLTGRRPTSLVSADREGAIEDLPAPLRPLVRRATEPEREARYPTAAALEAELRAALSGLEPVRPSAVPLVVQPTLLPSTPPAASIGDVDPAEFEGTRRPWRPPQQRQGSSALPTMISLDPDSEVVPAAAPSRPAGAREPAVPWVRLLVLVGLLTGAVTCGGLCAGGLAGGLGRMWFGS